MTNSQNNDSSTDLTMSTTSKKRKKPSSKQSSLRFAIDNCAKTNDLAAALALYDSTLSDPELSLSPHHYNAILHVISSSIENLSDQSSTSKQSAIDAAFDIFNAMLSSSATPNEATVTAMAKIAACRDDGAGGDVAFEFVTTMGEKYGALPKLRTYVPALMKFCRDSEAEKAYEVYRHMSSMGVVAEEAEISALLEVSAKVGREDKVYYYLHKLRESARCVGGSTAEILERWFGSEPAGKVECLDLDSEKVKDAILRNGGGWHGLGWIGKGSWQLQKAKVDGQGICSGCDLRLKCVDIDRMETEKFAESVAELAMQRESNSNFQKFQKWLDEHSWYEAVIDGANISLYQQNFADGSFNLFQLNAVVQEFFKRGQNKWPLIVLHERRIPKLMEDPHNRLLIETWKSAGALYTTPKGSNDDWYWLYAAVKLKCLLVTNDEMRDHIFELLGQSFFPRWKERHQVHYTFFRDNLSLMMPPPFSLAIQESETGSWHVPLDKNCYNEQSGTWLCISRQLDQAHTEKESADHSTTTLSDTKSISSVPVANIDGKQVSSS